MCACAGISTNFSCFTLTELTELHSFIHPSLLNTESTSLHPYCTFLLFHSYSHSFLIFFHYSFTYFSISSLHFSTSFIILSLLSFVIPSGPLLPYFRIHSFRYSIRILAPVPFLIPVFLNSSFLLPSFVSPFPYSFPSLLVPPLLIAS